MQHISYFFVAKIEGNQLEIIDTVKTKHFTILLKLGSLSFERIYFPTKTL